MDANVAAAIDERLGGVARDHGVAVPWAVESGSRAWGFPSPDSDYDCRFIFVRPMSAYAAPWRERDVVETPLDVVLDVNGWDLVKAVQLAVGGNVTVAEWLRSPLVYAGETAFRDDLLTLFEAVADRAAVGRHYLHVGRDQWVRSGAADGDEVLLKKVFYALRPACALHWMTLHDGTAPPMNLLELLAEAPPTAAVAEAIAELVAAKAVTRELGVGADPTPIRDFVATQFAAGEASYERVPPTDPDGARATASAAFLDLVERWADPLSDPARPDRPGPNCSGRGVVSGPGGPERGRRAP